MYVIELHDGETDDPEHGSLVARIGRNGSIYYAYQAEIHLHAVLREDWQKAYLKAGQKVKAIWTRDGAKGELKYLARTRDYDGE